MAAPMPRVPPVTSAIRSCVSFMVPPTAFGRLSLMYVGARSWLFRREARAADGLGRRDLRTGAVGQPADPVLPPGALVPLRARHPLLGIGRRLRIEEVAEPGVPWVCHHGLNVAARAQDELRAAGDQLGGPVAGVPRRDVVGASRHHVRVTSDA